MSLFGPRAVTRDTKLIVEHKVSRSSRTGDEVDPDNRLQPRPRSGSGERTSRITKAAGQYLRDLPRCEQSDGKTQAHPRALSSSHVTQSARLIGKKCTYRSAPSRLSSLLVRGDEFHDQSFLFESFASTNDEPGNALFLTSIANPSVDQVTLTPTNAYFSPSSVTAIYYTFIAPHRPPRHLSPPSALVVEAAAVSQRERSRSISRCSDRLRKLAKPDRSGPVPLPLRPR